MNETTVATKDEIGIRSKKKYAQVTVDLFNQDLFKELQMDKREPQLAKGVLTILNDRGLHSRPSTEIVRCASRFQSEIKLVHNNFEVNARSLVGILMLAAPKGAEIIITAKGTDAEKAVNALIDLAENKFYINY